MFACSDFDFSTTSRARGFSFDGVVGVIIDVDFLIVFMNVVLYVGGFRSLYCVVVIVVSVMSVICVLNFCVELMLLFGCVLNFCVVVMCDVFECDV